LKEQRNNSEYHRADPGRRRHVQWLLAATVLVAIAALIGLQAWLSRLIATTGSGSPAFEHALSHALGMLCIVLAAVAAAFAPWLLRLAAATRADRRWPPSSMRTSSDVKIRYLTSADALVAQMRGGALALVLLALGLAGWGVWLLRVG